MAKQNINQGTSPTGAGGDTFRSGSAKLQANDNELYTALGANASGVLPSALPVNKGGTGATTAATARTNLGLGTAATGTVTTSADDNTTGRLLKVGDFGLGGVSVATMEVPLSTGEVNNFSRRVVGDSSAAHGLPTGTFAMSTFAVASVNTFAIFYPMNVRHDIYAGNLALNNGSTTTKRFFKLLSESNTTTDSNGFIKAASPIVQLFADKIELNDEAQQQNIEFEKLGTGDYLIKGSSGFAQEGWYVETPKDANGNVLVAVVYEQLANGDISVKTFDYMLNNKGRIVADTETPLDIPETRWIDLRLQELPQPEIEVTDDPEQ